ncbi:CopG family transcriptional regulator [Dissulfurispira sp.]|uniref:ribbon-helix-helix domain-containing protein n=1 Tax=Dissulfurispira sp. TaxID=2817609 RepID=UPI002FD97716
MAKVRFQMFIEESQKEALERLQQDSGMSVAELVRTAINNFLSERRKKKERPADEITEKLLSVAGICKGGPPDLADNHDHYLYGFPKKK